ncbi:right-handed parallel beta-helix repeat-containing protein [Planctomycetota bacterium]
MNKNILFVALVMLAVIGGVAGLFIYRAAPQTMPDSGKEAENAAPKPEPVQEPEAKPIPVKEISINPKAPDAAQKLREALKGKAAIKLEPGIIEAELDEVAAPSITGTPEDPSQVTIRVVNPGQAAISAEGPGKLKISGITLAAGTGVEKAVGVKAADGIEVELINCVFDSSLAVPISLTEVKATVKGCTFRNIPGDALIIEKGTLTITDCEFENIEGCAIKAENVSLTADHVKVAYAEKTGLSAVGGNVTVSASAFENCSPTAIDIQTAKKVSITGCTVKNATEDAIVVLDAQEAEIKKNQCEDSGSAGIRLQGPGTVEKNTVRSKDKGTGIRVEGEGAVLIGNKLDHLTFGIDGRKTTGLLAENNTTRWCGTGIIIRGSEGANIRNNTGQACKGSCIAVLDSVETRVEKNTLSGSARGVLIQAGKAFVSGNTIKDCTETAIKTERRAQVEIAGNTMKGGNASAIVTWKTTADVHDNTIEGMGSGFYECSDLQLHGNTLINDSVTFGFYLENVKNGKVYGNTVGKGIKLGIKLHGCTDMEVFDNEISDRKAKGLQVCHAWNADIHHNRIHGNSEAGIYVTDMKNVNTYANQIYKNGIAMRYNETKGEVYDNLVHDNNEGIVFWENADVLSHHNECFNNSTGILYRSSWGESHHNNFYNNEWGFYLKSSRGKKIIIHDNEIHDSKRDGIRIEWSADCEIYRNRILNNGQCGFRIRPKSPVHIYENFIAGNGKWGVRAWEGNQVKLIRNVIAKNAYSGIAAGLNKSFTAEGNTIVGNMAGGVWAYEEGSINLTRNIIYRNAQSGLNPMPTGREGEGIKGSGTMTVKDNIIHMNGDGSTFAIAGVKDDGGNITGDPLLTDEQDDNYVPKGGSPAISQAGTIGALDPDGKTKIPFEAIPDTGPREKIGDDAGEGAEEAPKPEEIF